MKPRQGFTLVELLVTVGIIAVLIAMLLPVFSKVHNLGNEVKCQNNLRQLMSGMISFAADHDEHFTGSIYDMGDPIAWHHDWLGDGTFGGSPQNGLLFPYVGKDPSLYECPSMYEQAFNFGTWDSNGRFDYAIFVVWAGAAIHNIKPNSIMYRSDGSTVSMPTPIIVQEDGDEINAGNDEGGHSNIDQITHIHRGGGYYACLDGHTEWVIEPLSQAPGTQGVGGWDWIFTLPSGNTTTGGNNWYRWGNWNQN